MVRNFQTIENVVARLRSANRDEFVTLERSLRADSRTGVQKALQAAQRRLDAEAQEQARLESLYQFDREISSGIILGMDEVGRGPLAGPLAVGGVVLNYSKRIPGLNDSKKLLASKREYIAEKIKQDALAYVVHYIQPGEIDAIGMAASLRKAFSGVIEKIEACGIFPDVVLIDGVPLHIDPRERNIVKGDAKSASIAAASVVAKVERDKLMCDYSQQFPQYNFSSNKGYASSEHIAAIRAHGLCPLHRVSFCTAFTQESLF